MNVKTFSTNTPPGSRVATIGAKAKAILKMPQETIDVESGRLYRMPYSQAHDLIASSKAPIWIIA